MDLLSHALMGGLVASVGLQNKYGLAASATMVAANLIPDLDGALVVLGPRYFFQYHRHPLTHSLGGAALLSAALTATVCLATPLKRPWLVFGISFLGMMLHLLSDLLTPWPIPLLWPFSDRTYSLDLIPFFDPFLLAVLVTGFLVVNRRPEWDLPALLVTGLLIAGYLGFRAHGQRVALSLVGSNVSAAALPHGLNPVAWDVIVKGNGYTAHVVDVWPKQVRESKAILSAEEEPEAAISRRSDLVQGFLRRARFPVVSVTREGNGSRVEWGDVHLMLSGGLVRGVVVVLDEEGQIREERFELRGGKTEPTRSPCGL